MSDPAAVFALSTLPWGKVAAVISLGLLCGVLISRQWQRLGRLARATPDPADELELRLHTRELQLVHALALRSARVAGRVVLAGGTGLALLELIQGGAARLPQAALVFLAGGVAWAAGQEMVRRIGSWAEFARTRIPRARSDQAPTGGRPAEPE